MKRTYESPCIAVERFVLSNQISSCSAYKINSMDSICVINDSDSPPAMQDLAFDGYFLAEGLYDKHPMEEDPSLCYFTSSNLAFTS